MTYTRPVHGSPFADGSATDATVIVDALSDGLEAAEASIAALPATYQPLDSDLTAIAALSTTAFGRGLLALVDAAAARTAIGTVIGTDVQAHDGDLDAIAALSTTATGRSLLAIADAAAGRTILAAAPLDSPVFTGNPTVPTPAAGDNDTSIATTAFVQGKVQVTHPNTDDVLVKAWDTTAGALQTIYYDSGWRDVTALLVNGWTTSATVLLRRLNNTVFLSFKNSGLNGSSASADTVMTLPTGFRPGSGGSYHYWPNVLAAGTAVIEMDIGSSGAGVLRARTTVPTAGQIGRSGTSFVTNDSIPASLPGTLLSAAPY